MGAGTFNWLSGSGLTWFNPGTLLDVNATNADVGQFGNGGFMATTGNVNVSTQTIAGLIFNTTGFSGYALTAGSSQTLTVGTSGITVNAGAQASSVGSANLSVTLGGAESWINNSASALTVGAVGSTITNGGNALVLQAQGAGNINVAGTFAGTGAGTIQVNSTGTGSVVLSGVNTETGTTTLTAGILRATTNAGALGAGALALNGGTLQLANVSGTNLNFGRNTTVGGNTTILSDLTAAGAGNTYTLGTLSLGAFTLTVGAGEFVTSGPAGLNFGAGDVDGRGRDQHQQQLLQFRRYHADHAGQCYECRGANPHDRRNREHDHYGCRYHQYDERDHQEWRGDVDFQQHCGQHQYRFADHQRRICHCARGWGSGGD